ncbi:hypothetical protein [Abyssalbus ytuae]|uniref:TonB C-terminal domain-containing protein n=1 Tax=Abyssalbus ytuae TaxID=2926907 RepID=A0A9E6ZYM4_9FLAO|nr:hypothetical protein [Abyssalbus ytuae]UOB16281.1 hypothetical protein MQE35_11085 [Abyssalbus ytuae]
MKRKKLEPLISLNFNPMKCFIFIPFLFISFLGLSQVMEQEIIIGEDSSNNIFDNSKVEKKATFSGGEKLLFKFYKENSRIEITSLKKPLNSVYFNLFINEQGNVYDFQIIKYFKEEHKKEVCRLIRVMPKWMPAEHNGKKVKVSVLDYITFK